MQPDWKIADPICTFLFCILVLFSTLNVLKDALRVLMEGIVCACIFKNIMSSFWIPNLNESSGLDGLACVSLD